MNKSHSVREDDAEHQRRQARMGLSLTPAERLAWLERTNAEMRALLGLARKKETEQQRSQAGGRRPPGKAFER